MTTTVAHRQVLESELPNLTRQVGELVVEELAKKSVLTRRGDAAAHVKLLERSEATDVRRNSDQAVVAQLHSNASAASESVTAAAHLQVLQLRHDQHARRDLGEGVAPELMATASSHETKQREAHHELGHARQLRDVVGHGNELSSTQLRRTGDA